MQAGDLEDAVEIQAADQRVGLGQEKVVVEEIAQYLRVNQQRRVEVLWSCCGQALQLALQFGQQFVGGPRAGHGIADLFPDMNRFGEGAEVEADDGPLEPALGVGNDGLALAGFGKGRQNGVGGEGHEEGLVDWARQC